VKLPGFLKKKLLFKNGYMKSLFILTCIIVYLVSFWVDVRVLGFTAEAPSYTRLTYMFTHIGLLHLVLNMVSFHFLYTSVNMVIKSGVLFPVMILGAFLATYGAEMDLPTIGASGVVLFLFGGYAALYPSRNLLIYLSVFAVVNLVTYYFKNTNIFVHLHAFIFGLLFTLIYASWQNRKKKNRLSKI